MREKEGGREAERGKEGCRGRESGKERIKERKDERQMEQHRCPIDTENFASFTVLNQTE